MPGLYRYKLLFLVLASLLLLPAFSDLRAQWAKLSQFNDGTFYNEVFFYDQNLGFITTHSGSVLRTTNGGTNWATVSLPNATFSANRDICIVSAMDGFISGEDGIWRTSNAGSTWTNITPAGATGIGSSSSWFRNGRVGVWGYGHCLDSVVTFWRTNDGGATWTSVTYTHTPDVAVGGMTYTGGTFYAAGSSGKFWKSTDDGATWTLSNTNSVGWQEDLISTQSGSLLIASADGTSCGANGGGKILLSTNGGTNWTTTSYANTIIWGVSMYSPSNGWAAGDMGKAYKTSDGGVTWTESSCGLSPTDRLDDIFMIDGTHGFIVGDGIYRYVTNEFIARPDTIDFGNVIVGTWRGDSLAAVRALGTTGTITARAFAGLDASEFSSASPFSTPQPIPDCGEAVTPIRFQPTTPGAKIARIEFTVAGVGAPLIVYLKGRGVTPKIIGPKLHRLDTLVCQTELIDTIIYSNNGDHPLRIDSVVFANDVGYFSLISPVPDFEIQPLRSEEFIIRGRAVGNGMMSGRMYIYSNDPTYKDSSWVTALYMYKKRVEMKALPDTLLIIPSRPPDSNSSACLVFKNTGEAAMSAGQITTSSGDPTISASFGPADIKAGDSVVICFNAKAFDTLSHCKRFRIISQPCGIETFITVCYQASTGALDLPPKMTLEAGCNRTGQDTLYLHNRGNAVAGITGAEIVGTDKDRFVQNKPTSWPASIPPGDSLEIILSFTPDGTKGTSDAALVLTLADGSTDTLQLEGILRAPLINLTNRFNDIGPICPGIDASVTVILSNSGNDNGRVISVTPLDSEDRIVITSLPNGAIPPNEIDSINFTVHGTSAGPFSGRYAVVYDSPCLDPDTITVAGIVLDASLSILPSPINFGVVPTAGSSVARTVVRNTSDTAILVHVQDPGVPGVTVTHPTPLSADVELGPGDTLEITLLFAPGTEIDLDALLPVTASGRCDEAYTVSIRGKAVDEAVYLSGDLDLGTLLCDAVREDTIFIYNQSSGDIRVSNVVLSNEQAFSYRLPQNLPIPISPGNSIPLIIAAKTGIAGPFSTLVTVSLDQGPVTELTATVKADRQGPNTQFVERNGTPTTGLVLPSMSRCRISFDTVVILKNFGNSPDTITMSVTSFPILSLPSSLPVILAPDEMKEVAIHVDLASPGSFSASVRGTSRRCGSGMELTTTISYFMLDAGADLLFGSVCAGKDSTITSILRNPGGGPISVRELQVEGEGFRLASTAGFVIAPGQRETVLVTFSPSAEGAYTGKLRIITELPCADTIILPLAGDGIACSIPDLTLRSGSVRGRWGTVQSVPVTVSGFNMASVQEMSLTLTAAPRMLHPGSVRLSDWAAGSWSIADEKFDPAKGMLTLTLKQSLVPPPPPISSNLPLENETLFVVDYTVLRGDSISTDLDLEFVSVMPNGTVATEDGEFLLEDYCDAYGRLLRTTGNLALRPAVPNPATDVLRIEYELPFSGHAVLALFDPAGNEVLRMLDDVVPAGSRQSIADVSDLPSGVYIARLEIGLQKLTQQIIVTK